MTTENERVREKTKVLVVDDDAIGLLLATILRRKGYENTVVKDCGWDGLRAMGITETSAAPPPTADAPPFDVVLLDIILPDINGFEVCQRLRDAWGNQVAVILVTGFDIEQQHARFVECGADDFLMKPINSKELVNRIRLHASKLGHRRSSSKLTISCELEVKTIGGFRVKKTLSWSGSVVVYLAEKAGEEFVIKILTKQAMEYEDMRERFQREGALLEEFDHPNIVSFRGSGTHHGLPYFVTEFMHGENLEDFAINHDKPPFEQIVNIALSMARAIEHVHSKGVIHRDVKLKNTFLGPDGVVKIGDFGIALTKNSPRLTQAGYAIGTPIYMAPEQFKGESVTHKVDIYSFGASMYHLTTGLPPFTAGTAMELLRKHSSSTPRTINDTRPELTEDWNELIVNRCMAKRPEDRPASMTEVVAEIERIIRNQARHPERV